MRRTPASLALAVSVALLANGCTDDRSPSLAASSGAGAHSTAVTRVGTVTGQLLLVGGPAPGVRWLSRGGHVTLVGATTLVVPVDDAGRYSATVSEGVYRVTGRSPQYGSGTYECQAVRAVRVVVGATVTSDVYCQMP